MTDEKKKSDEEEDATPTPRVFNPGAPTQKISVPDVPVVEPSPMRPTTPRWERTGPVTRPPRRDSETPRAEHIVIVEDDADIRNTLLMILTDEGYSVRTASNGIEALEKIFGDSVLPDMVLLDIGLPKLTGVAVEAAIIAEMGTRGMMPMPICIITAGNVARLPEAMRARGRVFDKAKMKLDELLAILRADIATWRSYLERT